MASPKLRTSPSGSRSFLDPLRGFLLLAIVLAAGLTREARADVVVSTRLDEESMRKMLCADERVGDACGTDVYGGRLTCAAGTCTDGQACVRCEPPPHQSHLPVRVDEPRSVVLASDGGTNVENEPGVVRMKWFGRAGGAVSLAALVSIGALWVVHRRRSRSGAKRLNVGFWAFAVAVELTGATLMLVGLTGIDDARTEAIDARRVTIYPVRGDFSYLDRWRRNELPNLEKLLVEKGRLPPKD